MHQHTLVFDTELGTEDIAIYENCAGVVGLAAYENVLNIYYEHPPGRQELRSLAEACVAHSFEGVSLVGDDLSNA